MKCRVHSDYGVAFSLYSVHDIQSCMEAMLATIQSMAVRAHIQVIKRYILSLTSRGSGASAFIHARLDDAVQVGAAVVVEVAAQPTRRGAHAQQHHDSGQQAAASTVIAARLHRSLI
jgi:hypothetical protein